MSKRKEKRLAKARKRKRIFQLVGGIGLAGILTASILSYKALSQKLDTNHNQYHSVASSLEEITFEEAKQDKRLRKSYIEQIVKNNPPPIENIIIEYDPKIEFIPSNLVTGKKMVIMTRATIQGESYDVSNVKNIVTTIYKGIFNETQSEDEFLCGLVDHEYEHINLFSGKVKVEIYEPARGEFKKRCCDASNGDLFYIFHELFAFSNEIKQFSIRKNLRKGYRLDIINSYNSYRRLVEEKPETPLTKWLLENYPRVIENE